MTEPTPARKAGWWLLPVVLLLGLGVGLGIGLLLSWQIWPVEYTDVAPDSLYVSHRQEYILLIGQTYAYDHHLPAAQARIASLGDPAIVGPEVAALAERYVTQQGNPVYTAALSELAVALGYPRASLVAYLSGDVPVATWTPLPTETPPPLPTETPTPLPTETSTPEPTVTPIPTATETATPRPTATKTATPTPSTSETRVRVTPPPTYTPTTAPTKRPTRAPTSTPTPAPGYAVVEQTRTCEVRGGQLMVMVLDQEGQPQPNIELLVRWDLGDDRFFTGLKPEVGPGYADFAMAKDHVYQVVVVGAESQVAQGIVADTCAEGYLASWQIAFQWRGEAQ